MKKLVFTMLLAVLGACCATPRPENAEFRELLKEHALVVYKDGKTIFYDESGIRPVLLHLKQGSFKDAFVADRIIGKASALLLVYGGVQEVYTPIVSKPAVAVFRQYGVKYEADEVIENVLNRRKDGLCPMERKVVHVDSPAEAYRIFSTD